LTDLSHTCSTIPSGIFQDIPDAGGRWLPRKSILLVRSC
jgi:hypothetical protein